MATPTTYVRSYTWKGRSNQTMSATETYISKSSFKVSGNTTEPIGKIIKIEFEHYHSASGKNKTWKLKGLFLPGWYSSNIISHTFNGDIYKYKNTFVENLPTPEEFENWTYMVIQKQNTPSGSDIYWRATSDYPMVVRVYFWSKKDMVDGADPPVISGVSYTDNLGYKDRFQYFVQNKSDVTITGNYTLDTRYEFISASHTMSLTDSDGKTYTMTQSDDSVFNFGVIDLSGTVSLSYNVTDNAGNSVDYTSTFTILEYYSPKFLISSDEDTVFERYTIPVDGDPEYSDDGEYIWINLDTDVCAFQNASTYEKNEWVITCRFKAESEDDYVYVYVASGNNGGSFSVVKDQTILTEDNVLPESIVPVIGQDGRIVFISSEKYEFEFAIADCFETVILSGSIDEAGAFCNVYPYGVSVGMRGTGTSEEKKFEVAEDILTHLYGGLHGVTQYGKKSNNIWSNPGEVDTYGKWINGKQIYRQVFEVQHINAGDSSTTPKFSISNVDTLIDIHGVLKRTNGNFYPAPYRATSDAAYAIDIYMNSSGGVVIRTGSGMEIQNGYIVCYYTKQDSNPLSMLSMITGNNTFSNEYGNHISDEDAIKIITGEDM